VPQPGTTFFQGLPSPSRDRLLDDLLDAEMLRNEGITQNTKDKECRVWRRWTEYSKSIGFSHDIWLSILLPNQRVQIIGAFAAALRRRQFSRPDEKCLVASTVQETVAKLGEIFRSNVGYNPTHGDGVNTLHPLLTRQFKGMRNLDPGDKQQKALPVSVYRKLHAEANNSNLPLDKRVAWLQTLAYFWCMRSCEYSDTQGERRTKILCVRNLRFFDDQNRDISSQLDLLTDSITVSITFEFQKKEVRNDTISHQRSGDSIGGKEMCPVRAAAEIVKSIATYKLPTEKFTNTPINYLEIDGKGFTIPSTMVLTKIRQAVTSLGPAVLGFSAEDVGTHSNRSGGAMGMFLSGTPVYTIMLMGRWSSDAFMRYIRKQVLSLSHGIAAKMLTYEQFYTVPDFIHTTADGDIRHRSNTNLAVTKNFNGQHANMRRGLHPTFHLSH
jgi:hypothetical protein